MDEQVSKMVVLAVRQRGKFCVQILDDDGWHTIGRFSTESFARLMRDKAVRTFNTEMVRVVS